MTIEERADAYVGHPEEIDEFTSETIKRKAYIVGAKEQKAIDIGKVCEWLRVRNVITKDTLMGFRKAMEEEE